MHGLNLIHRKNSMGKDPAFLFYPGDWTSGTQGYTFEEKGAYLTLLCVQFDRDILPGENEFQDLLTRYHGAISSAPENDAGLLGKGFRGRFSPDRPITSDELNERYSEITFTSFEPVLSQD